MARTLERSRESTDQISVARALLATSSVQRGCVSQTISASGKEARRAATAGKVWTISPREPRRTTRKRGSGMRLLADGGEEGAGGVVFGVADDGDADAETIRDGAFGNGVGGVVGALGVDVGAKLFEQFFNVGLGKDHDVVHHAQGGDEESARVFIQDGTAGPFQRGNARIGVDADDEDLSLLLGAGEIANVADVERIEAAVGEDDGLPAEFRGGK